MLPLPPRFYPWTRRDHTSAPLAGRKPGQTRLHSTRTYAPTACAGRVPSDGSVAVRVGPHGDALCSEGRVPTCRAEPVRGE